jgi:hypothetical protein
VEDFTTTITVLQKTIANVGCDAAGSSYLACYRTVAQVLMSRSISPATRSTGSGPAGPGSVSRSAEHIRRGGDGCLVDRQPDSMDHRV